MSMARRQRRSSQDDSAFASAPLSNKLLTESAPVQITMTNFPGVEAQENFPLLRSKTELFPTTSSGSLDNLQNTTTLQQRIAQLEKLITEMRFRLEEMEEDTGSRTRWGVRYSRRMAIIANIFIGFWRFFDVFLELLQKRRRQIMHSLLSRKGDKLNENINKVFQLSYKSGIKRSFIYLICALLLYSKFAWKRSWGLFLSSATSIWIVYSEPQNSPLAQYFTLFANILYGTASWSLNNREKKEKNANGANGANGASLPSTSSTYQRFKGFFRDAMEHF